MPVAEVAAVGHNHRPQTDRVRATPTERSVDPLAARMAKVVEVLRISPEVEREEDAGPATGADAADGPNGCRVCPPKSVSGSSSG
jgi:hypothetical protein